MVKSKFSITFDVKKSMRSYDDNGYLHVALTPISKACVNPYYGYEIPDWMKLGLQRNRIYFGLRDPDELKKGAPTFNGLPLLMDHHSISADIPAKEYVVGATGTDAVFDGTYLKNSLAVHDAEAIRSIEDGSTREISCAYRFTPDFTPGVFNMDGDSIHYNFIMRDISGNHVALVAEGRAGHDVAVADSLPKITRRENGNVRTRKVTRKITRKSFASEKKVAKDSIDSLIAEFAPDLDEEHRAAFKAALAVAQNTEPVIAEAAPEEVIEEEIVEEAVPEEKTEPAEETAEETPEDGTEVPPEENPEEDAKDVDEAVTEVLEGEGTPEEKAGKLAEKLEAVEEETEEDAKDPEEAEPPAEPEETEEVVEEEAVEEPEEPEEEPAEDEAEDLDEQLKDPKFKAGFDVGFLARKAYETFLKAHKDGEVADEELPEEETILTEDTLARLKAQATENARQQCMELTEAAEKVSSLIGTIVNPMAYDSAADIYKLALKRAGKNPDAYDKATCKAIVEMLLDKKPSYAAMVNTKKEKEHDCFRFLKNISR